jgi:FAD/FMN-containing dehydrogenase
MSTVVQMGSELTSRISDLRMRFHGRIIDPGDAGYDDARMVRNGLIDRHPGLIAQCAGVADIVEAVNFARENNLLVSVRGGGHNVAGSAVNDGGIVIDLSMMRSVHVDPVARTARVEGGATWGDVDRETQLFGLATPGGVISSTGVGGLSLHGGWGWLRRKYGYCIDNILSVDIVTADGQVRTADATWNQDLYWAVRGAGSNFGVVASIVYQLHPIPSELMLAAPVYRLADAPKIARAWREYVKDNPDEISGELMFWGAPAADFVPLEDQGQPVVITPAMYAGPAEEGERAMQPLREFATPIVDLSHAAPYTAQQSGFDWAFPKGAFYYFKSRYVDGLPDDLIDHLIGLAASRPAPTILIAVWQLGGAPSRVPETATPFANRDKPFLVSIDSMWTDPADDERCIQWSRDAWKSLDPWSNGGLYLNFAGFGEEKEELVRAGYGANYERLAALKRQYDPTNLFRMNQNIKPAAL